MPRAHRTATVDTPTHEDMRVDELQELLRCSRAMAYTTAQAIGVIRVGRAVRVPAAGLRRWLAEQAT